MENFIKRMFLLIETFHNHNQELNSLDIQNDCWWRRERGVGGKSAEEDQ
jgi:hypothetical protein